MVGSGEGFEGMIAIVSEPIDGGEPQVELTKAGPDEAQDVARILALAVEAKKRVKAFRLVPLAAAWGDDAIVFTSPYDFEIVDLRGAMIVVLTYFSDGSGEPEIEFIEAGLDQVERVARTLVSASEAGRRVEAYKIEALDKPALCISEVDDA